MKTFAKASLIGLFFLLTPKAMEAQYQFGYLSYSKALQSMPDYAKAQEALNSLQNKYKEEAQYNEEKFKKMFADYLQGQKNFPEQIMLKRQKELQVAMEQGISFRKDAQRLLDNAEKDLIGPMQARLDSVLTLIGKENGLSFIANTDGKGLPFINSAAGADITEAVLARLSGKVIPINDPKILAAPAAAPAAASATQPKANDTPQPNP